MRGFVDVSPEHAQRLLRVPGWIDPESPPPDQPASASSPEPKDDRDRLVELMNLGPAVLMRLGRDMKLKVFGKKPIELARDIIECEKSNREADALSANNSAEK